MADPIILPPLPNPEYFDSYTADQMRARDMEIVRLVLEAAAKRAATEDVAETDNPMGVQQCIVFGIRALEFRHD